MAVHRTTVVLEGPLSHRMARLAAARKKELGVQLLSLPTLAARLAGGFARPAEPTDLDAAIRSALDEGGFTDFQSIRHLPGMTRAAARTLGKVWNSDLDLKALAISSGSRLADLQLIDQRVRTKLPAGVLTPRDLRDAALARIAHAPAVLGATRLERVGVVDAVWRPLIAALSSVVAVEWRNPGTEDIVWFQGAVLRDSVQAVPAPVAVTCANPRAEVVESLRWARELVATGRARPEEVAICATAAGDWDEHFMALSGDISVPLHFSHGLPAIASWDGQYCAALADPMLNGLTQDRVRRLIGYARERSPALGKLPRDWAYGLRSGASLMEFEQWSRALEECNKQRTDGVDIKALLLPQLAKLAAGPGHAEELGELLLPTGTRRLWGEALRRAPATAIDLSLADLRVPDTRDAGVCVVWCPASHLAASPRKWVRLLGLTARSWPRASPDDPLLPEHVLPRGSLVQDSLAEQDRRAFKLITAQAVGGTVLSRSRRNAQGGLVAPSPLLKRGAPAAQLKLTRIPSHAFSESDRLLARPEDASTTTRIAGAVSCWKDWRTRGITPHDGNARADHPVVAQALRAVQSATSLRRMLRDPLAFVWRYALGWRSFVEEEQPLSLDPKSYGELVHALLKLTVDSLEAAEGYTRSSKDQIETALARAKESVAEQWPLERSVPPPLLWRHTIDLAASLASRALTHDEVMQGTRSWTEVPFGELGGQVPPSAPWNIAAPVLIPGTSVGVKGSIDRIDLKENGIAVRVSDYKTGAVPKKPEAIVIAGGRELQRVVYAIASRQLLPGPPKVVARLLFLLAKEPQEFKLLDKDVAGAIQTTSEFVSAAVELLSQGTFLPAGPDVVEPWNEYRLMLPASSFYLTDKRFEFNRRYETLKKRWQQA